MFFDAYEDVFYSEFQREGRLDLGARASFWRIFTTMAVFCLLVVLTDSLFIASLVSLAASVVALVVAFYPGHAPVLASPPPGIGRLLSAS